MHFLFSGVFCNHVWVACQEQIVVFLVLDDLDYFVVSCFQLFYEPSLDFSQLLTHLSLLELELD